jgi:hypothetical protein
MKFSLKSALIAILTAASIAPALVFAGSASAQPKGTNANYIGAGPSFGLTNGGSTTGGDAATLGGNIQGRLTTPVQGVSVRGAIDFSDETSAITPMVSYDVPIAKNTNAYIMGGYSFVESSGKPTPQGNQNAPVVGIGVESQVGNNVVVYGNTKLGINAYQNSPASAVNVGVGAGFMF